MLCAQNAIILGKIYLINFYSATCFNGTEIDCLTCLPGNIREFYETTGKCYCIGGYYDDGESAKCSLCHHSWFPFHFFHSFKATHVLIAMQLKIASAVTIIPIEYLLKFWDLKDNAIAILDFMK